MAVHSNRYRKKLAKVSREKRALRSLPMAMGRAPAKEVAVVVVAAVAGAVAAGAAHRRGPMASLSAAKAARRVPVVPMMATCPRAHRRPRVWLVRTAGIAMTAALPRR